MAGFRPGSHSFYGDGAHLKVAARRDSTVQENLRLKQLAQQVRSNLNTFLLGVNDHLNKYLFTK